MANIVLGSSVSMFHHSKLRDLEERGTERIQESRGQERCEMITSGHDMVAAFTKSQELRWPTEVLHKIKLAHMYDMYDKGSFELLVFQEELVVVDDNLLIS